MIDTIDDVIVVGGGDIGLLTALNVQKLNPGIDVSVVDDFQPRSPR
jgi:tryptophan halogenase